MAVIESKGDGYSLFNGVKLLNLPEYDKENFPCAMVIRYDDGEQYRLYVSKNPFYWATSEQCCECAENTIAIWKLTGSASNWEVYKSAYYTTGSSINDAFIPAWSNYDILNSPNNSVYLAASEPISLDGMNVIEWDGDTTGLEVSQSFNNFYRISTKTDIDTNKPSVQTRITVSSGHISVGTVNCTEADGYWKVGAVRYVPTESENYPMTGIFAVSNATLIQSLVAYYPIETGGDLSFIKFLASPKYPGLPKGIWGWKLAQKRGGNKK